MELAPLTVLNQRYTVKRTLGDPGPFDITYLGQDVNSEEEYIIREFFPVHLVSRESEATAVNVDEDDADLFDAGIEYFRKESEVLAELEHEALPASYDTFEANGTLYRVRPNPKSMSLQKGLEDRGQLSEKAALNIMIPILEALHEAHDNGLYHGGVSPQTIRLLEGGDVLLTGFRGAFYQLARESGNLSDLVQKGTSPVEQYTPRGQQGPWTDVYAAAATICQMVTGESLPESTDRLEGDDSLESLVQDADVFSSPGVREALVDALAVDPSKRLQEVDALRRALIESSTKYDEDEASYSIISVEPETEAETDDAEEEVEVLSTRSEKDRPARSSKKEEEGSTSKVALMVGIPVLLLALGGGAWFMMSAGGSSSASANAESSGAYEEYRSRADSLFEKQDYQTAEFLYNQALEIREDDEYVQQRLQELEDIQSESDQERYERHLRRGNELKAAADSLYNAGELGEANDRYNEAAGAFYAARDVDPEGDEAQQRIEEVNAQQEAIVKKRLSENQSQQQAQQQQQPDDGLSLDQLAKFFREQGARQRRAGNLKAALDKYKQAQEYAPEDPSLNQTISELEEKIEEQEQTNQFQSNYNRGQQLLRQEKYKEAMEAFEKALNVMKEPRAEQAYATAKKLLEEQRRKDQRYERYRKRGDSLLEEEAFEEAVTAYEEALQIRPDDEYARKRLEEAKRELEQVQLAEQEMSEEEKKRQDIIDEDGVYTTVDKEPEVKGGLETLTKAASYPDQARQQGLEGRVYVQATVNKDGTVRGAEVIRGLGGGADEEALRVVQNAEFIPGKYNGDPVPARTTVWIQFQISE